MSAQDGGMAPDWLVHLLADQADRDSRNAYDSQATIEATARGRADYIAKRLLGDRAWIVVDQAEAYCSCNVAKDAPALVIVPDCGHFGEAAGQVISRPTPSEQPTREPTEAGK